MAKGAHSAEPALVTVTPLPDTNKQLSSSALPWLRWFKGRVGFN